MSGVTLKFPASGVASNTATLPYPAHESTVTVGTQQHVGKTNSGVTFVHDRGGLFYRVTRKFESLTELEINELISFLTAIGFAKGEIRYEYVDAANGETRVVHCRIVYPTGQTKLMRHVRDVSIVFEQFVHPDHVSDESSVELGSYGGGAVGAGTPSYPLITSALRVTGEQDSAFSYTITAQGAASITFGAAGLPSWLSRTGAVISGTPVAADVGKYEFTITASNGSGTDTRTLVIVVAATPAEPTPYAEAPSIRSPSAANVYEEIPFSIPLVTSGSLPLAFSSDDAPGWVTVDPDTGTLTGTPPDEPSPSVVSFTVDAENDEGSDSQLITLTILESAAPTITSDSERVVLPGDTVFHALEATGTDPITWDVDETDLPAWAEFDADLGGIIIAPASDLSPEIQDAAVDVEAENGAGNDTQILTLRTGIVAEILTVEDTTFDVPANDAPVDIDFTFRGTDVTVSLVGAPAWATLVDVDEEAGTGTLRLDPPSLAWRVGGVNVNPFVFDLKVSNVHLGGADDTQAITVTVTEAPVIYSSSATLTTPYTGPTVTRSIQYYSMGASNEVGIDFAAGAGGEGVWWSLSTGGGPPPTAQTINLHPTGPGEIGTYAFSWWAENEYGRTDVPFGIVIAP